MQLHFREYGSSGPALVILHGLLGASGNWHTLASKSFSDSFHVYAVDMRNHGRSPHSDRFDLPTMAEDVRAFLKQTGHASAHVLGHSMGGKVAMLLALESPEVVDRLVVVDIAPRAYPPHHTEILEALRLLDPGAYSSRTEIDRALSERIASATVRQFLLKNLALDKDTGAYRWQANIEGIDRNYDAINAAIESNSTFNGPALFVRGEKSDYVQDEDREQILKLFPNARIETISGAGHWVHAEAPEPFAQTVLSFLTS